VGSGGFERGYRDPILFLSDFWSRLRLSPSKFCASSIHRLFWRYSTVNDGVTRFKGILKFSEA
jgi:hypothetical protein